MRSREEQDSAKFRDRSLSWSDRFRQDLQDSLESGRGSAWTNIRTYQDYTLVARPKAGIMTKWQRCEISEKLQGKAKDL